jgi:hypothetical protein
MRNVAIVGAGMTPFAEHFELGVKDLVPMAYAEAVAKVDKGIEKSEIEAAWFGELSTTDGFPTRSGTERWPSPPASTTWCWWSGPTRSARPPRTPRSGTGRR